MVMPISHRVRQPGALYRAAVTRPGGNIASKYGPHVVASPGDGRHESFNSPCHDEGLGLTRGVCWVGDVRSPGGVVAEP